MRLLGFGHGSAILQRELVWALGRGSLTSHPLCSRYGIATLDARMAELLEPLCPWTSLPRAP